MLGLPPRLSKALEQAPWSPEAARSMRFDFHPTEDGWQISEVNSDVPGGYGEASIFTRLMAEEIGGCVPSGDPLEQLAEALSKADRRSVALLAAPGFNEDLQVTRTVGRCLEKRGVEVAFLRPDQIVWNHGVAHHRAEGELCRIDAIFRFFQAEWLARLPAEHWRPLFAGGHTPVCNPPSAVFTESKRLPLLWPRLQTARPAWHRLLPEARSPFGALFASQRDWLLKATYSNTGDAVFGGDWTPRGQYRRAALAAMLCPRQWLLQRRFRPLPLATPLGPMQLCLGVYVIAGEACGIYARLTTKSWVDHSAMDVAVCLSEAS
jgi:glutathionylspermidine synthase